MLADKIGYIKIDSFKDELNNEFRKAYKDLEDKGMKGLVLDMRNNPGGLVVSAQEICGAFLPKDSLVSQFRHKNNEQRKIYSIGRQIVFIPVALLVNKHSASSAEIVSAALKDHGVATLIGSTTRGKGSVQRTNELDGGCALKLTIEKIYSPNGTGINKTGIQPHIESPMELEMIGTDKDSQMKKAIEFLKKKTAEEK
jgi:carboxyl-terminal processing protease